MIPAFTEAVLLPPCTPQRYGPVTQPELSNYVAPGVGACLGAIYVLTAHAMRVRPETNLVCEMGCWSCWTPENPGDGTLRAFLIDFHLLARHPTHPAAVASIRVLGWSCGIHVVMS